MSQERQYEPAAALNGKWSHQMGGMLAQPTETPVEF